MGIKVEMTEGQKDTLESQKELKEVVVKEEPKYVRLEDLEKVNQAIANTREYNNRQLADIKEAIARLTPKEPVKTVDEDLDAIAEKDWKLGVEKVVERVISKRDATSSRQTEEQRTASILEESKNKVMERHPELSDPNSPKTKEFLKVLEENPDFRANPRGPMLAAYEMENRMKTHDSIKVEDKEYKSLDRTVRSKATSVQAGTSPSSRGSYSLSKTDLDFCRTNGINQENYKKFKGMREVSNG